MTINENEKLNLIFESDINHHFNWITQTNKLSVLYYEGFKNKHDINIYLKLQISFLNFIEKELLKKVNYCSFFLAIENHGKRIEDYYKVWKRVERDFKSNFFFNKQEMAYKSDYQNYYIGLADFKESELKDAFAIQKEFYNQSYIFLNTGDSKNFVKMQTIADFFLGKETNQGFDRIISKYCTEDMFLIRVGDGGEDWEIALIFVGDLKHKPAI